MAHVSLVLAGLVGASYLVFWLLNQAVTVRRQAARAQEWGCKEPPLEAFRWPLGIDNIMRCLEADKQKCFPDFFVRRVEAMGVYTWQYYLFGKRIITTQEPKNIQAILAGQFGTFDLGPQRRGLVRLRINSIHKPAALLISLTRPSHCFSSGRCSETASSPSPARNGSTRAR